MKYVQKTFRTWKYTVLMKLTRTRQLHQLRSLFIKPGLKRKVSVITISQYLLSLSSWKQQSHFHRAFPQWTTLHSSTNESSLWRFGSIFAVNRTDAPALLGVSVGIFPSTYSTRCRWTHHCAFSSTHQLQLPFNMAFLSSWSARKVR